MCEILAMVAAITKDKEMQKRWVKILIGYYVISIGMMYAVYGSKRMNAQIRRIFEWEKSFCMKLMQKFKNILKGEKKYADYR